MARLPTCNDSADERAELRIIRSPHARRWTACRGTSVRFSGPVGIAATGRESALVPWTKDSFHYGEQRCEPVTSPRCVPRVPCPAGEVAADVQSVRVFRTENPLHHGEQRCELVTSPSRVSGLASEGRKVNATAKGAWMLSSKYPSTCQYNSCRLLARLARISRFSSPVGEVAAGDQGIGVVGNSLRASSSEPVTYQVPTRQGFRRPSTTAPDACRALSCGNQTVLDHLRRNSSAWHAEGQGFESP
jgi:hypothetical protein